MEKTGFCDVGCGLGFNLFGGVFCESAAECEYAANFTNVTFLRLQISNIHVIFVMYLDV